MGNSSSRKCKQHMNRRNEIAIKDVRAARIDERPLTFEENFNSRQACEQQRRSVSSVLHFPTATNDCSAPQRDKKRCFSETNVLLTGVLRKEPLFRNFESDARLGNCDRFTRDKLLPLLGQKDSVDAADDCESKFPFALSSDEFNRVYQSLKREEQLMSEIRLLKLQKIMLKNRLDSMEHDRETLKIKCQALELQLNQRDRSVSTPSLLSPRSPIIRKADDQRVRESYHRNLDSSLWLSDRRINKAHSRPQVTFNLTPDTIQYSSTDDPLDSFDILCQKLKSEINVLETQLNNVNRRVQMPSSYRSPTWLAKRSVRH
uniref:Uncharacterized protein n=1 Tax=Trichuris muris TaxID=70415 RepID=A0A5S6QZG7_TRIMR